MKFAHSKKHMHRGERFKWSCTCSFTERLSVIYNFLEFFQEFHKNRLQYKKQLRDCFSGLQVTLVRLWGLWFFVIIVTQVQFLRTSQRQIFCYQVDQKKIKEKKLLLCSIPLICIRGTKTHVSKCLRIGPKWFESRL